MSSISWCPKSGETEKKKKSKKDIGLKGATHD